MSVNGTIMVACGTIVGVTDFLIGRYFISMTPERAAEIWKGNPTAQSQAHLMGKILMISAPILFAILAGIGLSGMVD